jgi:ubiquinol-cytochrome c reductase cytochrome c subunit
VRTRQVIGAAVLGVTVLLGLFSFAGAAGAATHKGSPPTVVKEIIPKAAYFYDQFNSGTANSSNRIFGKNGQLLSYGDSDVVYYLPQVLATGKTPAALWALGEQLYVQNCEACHGVLENGVPPKGNQAVGYPDLTGLGPATYDFWIESGRMPAASTPSTQPMRRPARLDKLQALAISDFLNTKSKECPYCYAATPLIPIVQNLTTANLSDGAALFQMNCAACHTITGDGDALAYATFAPSLRDIPATQVAEALRTGPANMPIFSGNLTDAQLRDVVAYVTERIEHPQNPGGLGLGGIGPVAEGFIGLALGVGLLALVGFWIGDRTTPSEPIPLPHGSEGAKP